jgi:hypothetical protein
MDDYVVRWWFRTLSWLEMTPHITRDYKRLSKNLGFETSIAHNSSIKLF